MNPVNRILGGGARRQPDDHLRSPGSGKAEQDRDQIEPNSATQTAVLEDRRLSFHQLVILMDAARHHSVVK
ncbi:hypothetical protein GCM10009582_02270 [Arthrobacter flavus]